MQEKLRENFSDPIVLIVDDEKDFRETLQILLINRGYAVECVGSGNLAGKIIDRRVKELGAQSIKVVLSDWMMEDGNGIDLLKKIRAIHKSVPFILMSGAVTEEELRKTFKLEPDGVLLKPFDIESLVEKIEGAVKNRKTKKSPGHEA